MLSTLFVALRTLIVLSLLTGVLYPALVLGVGRLAFPEQASGSLIERDGRIVGSRLVGQPFAAPKWFESRPSATGAHPYDARASSGSNLGPTTPALAELVRSRVERWRGASSGAVPVDLVTSSGSGLDPHLSPAAALFQVDRVAAARGLAPEHVRALVLDHVEGRTFGVLGEPRVNVLELNLALDRLH